MEFKNLQFFVIFLFTDHKEIEGESEGETEEEKEGDEEGRRGEGKGDR